MSIEFCPKCQVLRSMRVTETKSKKTNSEGKSVELIILTYHCQKCNTFVRNEEIEEPTDNSNWFFDHVSIILSLSSE